MFNKAHAVENKRHDDVFKIILGAITCATALVVGTNEKTAHFNTLP